ncbi:MAG: DUF1566 domain-containing protein [Rhodanobacteraceae bacterium]|nr:DUF1566 domain-containing protein [Rhodanobacteraceae bacterium]
MNASRRHPVVLAALLLLASPLALAAQPLNDTGQVTCYNASAATGTVSPATQDPEQAGFNEQDCTRGASAADALGVMTKVGASTTPGRDYSKIGNDGSVLDASAALGNGPTDWACTRDNITGLIWEVKTDDGGLRDKDWTYTWYDTNAAINGGTAGTATGANCNATLAQCNTSAYRDAINALSGSSRLCGNTDWRLPTGKELQSLVDYGHAAAPYIDTDWFPNAVNTIYWSGQNYAAYAVVAWVVLFSNGHLGADSKSISNRVRLVRGGQ